MASSGCESTEHKHICSDCEEKNNRKKNTFVCHQLIDSANDWRRSISLNSRAQIRLNSFEKGKMRHHKKAIKLKQQRMEKERERQKTQIENLKIKHKIGSNHFNRKRLNKILTIIILWSYTK